MTASSVAPNAATVAPTQAAGDGERINASDAALTHRYRLIAPLCQSRVVRDLGASADTERSVREVAARFLGSDEAPEVRAQVLLSLVPRLESEVIADAALFKQLLANGGVLAVACRSDRGLFGTSAPPLAEVFSHHCCFIERGLEGTVFVDSRYAKARVVPLQDGMRADEAAVFIHLYSNSPLPAIATGAFEFTTGDSGVVVDRVGRPPPPVETPSVRGGDRRHAAIPFIERLLSVEKDLVHLHMTNTRLGVEIRNLKAGGAGSSGGWFDVPRTKHEWFLAERSDLEAYSSDPYHARVDDPVIEESRAGEAFLTKHKLLEQRPDLKAALAVLRPRSAGLSITDTPDVSIVIPIYGQLAYTLNCLDSLFAHQSRFTAEIIIIDDCSPDNSGEILPGVDGIRYHRQAKNGGFIQSCNTGGRMARGRYVVMLNNDTRVVKGWLDGLIDSFDLFPNAGLVGSKMLYPDGTLQEAGGIIWRDAAAWNYGRNDDPNRPQYSYARQVDYISGCSIALPRTLWETLEGFDPHFAPAYCEDVDLCFRVVAAGREVWFQPQSRVIHYEGKTSGTDTKSGVKAYQVLNTKKLFLRWREKLLSHRRDGEASFLERERGVRKRILVVDATAPTPNQDAGSVQTVLGLRVCQALGYKTHFVPADNWLFQPDYITPLQREGIDCAYAPYELGFENYISRYGWSFDIVLVYRVGTLDPIIDQIRQHAPQAAVLFHLADLHYIRMQRQATVENDADAMKDAAAMKVRELALVNKVDCTITHSEVERDILAEEVPGAPVALWPLMIEHAGTAVPFSARRDVVFLGGYRHQPNVDAVLYFVKEIFPRLLKKHPELRFIIAGAHPPQEIKDLASDRIVVTGMVDDLREVFDAARVFVSPLRFGAGAKGKVMSALAYGLPIVSTSIGVEGAGLATGEHVLVADEPDAFAAEVSKLYESEALWNQLSAAGQTLIKESFSTRMGEQVLRETIERALHHKLLEAPNIVVAEEAKTKASQS